MSDDFEFVVQPSRDWSAKPRWPSRKAWFWIGAAVLAVAWLSRPSPPRDPRAECEARPSNAVVLVAREYVRSYLVSPLSARWQSERTLWLGKGVCRVTGIVHSQNRLGVYLPATYRVDLVPSGDGWALGGAVDIREWR